MALVVLGLLQAHWTHTGFDGSAHMAEETRDPRRTAPWGIVISVGLSGIVGYALLIALTLAIRSVPEALSARDAQGNAIPAAIAILTSALGTKFGNMMAALASMAMWFCGLSCVTSASRAVYSLARDRGLPFFGLFERVNNKRGTPGPAIWAVVLATIFAMAWTGAVPIVTSLSTVSLYLAYVIPVALGLRARLAGSHWPALATWSLGRWGIAVNVTAVLYTVFIAVVLIAPPNELAGKTLATVVTILGALCFLAVKRKFQGPEWARSEPRTEAGS